jgi:hypothetical protein
MEEILIIILVFNIYLALKIHKIQQLLLILARGEDQIIEDINLIQRDINDIKE